MRKVLTLWKNRLYDLLLPITTRAFGSLIGTLVAVTASFLYTQEETGVFFFYISTLQTLSLLCRFGSDHSLVSSNKKSESIASSDYLILGIIISMFLSVIGLIANSWIINSVIWFSIFIGLPFFTTQSTICFMILRDRMLNWHIFYRNIFWQFVMIIFLIYGKRNGLNINQVALFSIILSSAFCIIANLNYLKIKFKNLTYRCINAASVSVVYLPTLLASTLLINSPIILSGLTISLEETAIIGLGIKFSAFQTMISGVIMLNITKHVRKKKTLDIRLLLNQSLIISLVANSLFTIVIFSLGNTIISILFNDLSQNQDIVFGIILLAFTARSASSIIEHTLSIIFDPKFAFLTQATSLIPFLSILYFSKGISILGFVIAFCLSNLIGLFCGLYLTKKFIPCGLFNLSNDEKAS